MDITIKHIGPELINDYLFFFDNMVFTEHPDWSRCYCYSFHFTGTKKQWNKKDNREAVMKLIQEGKMRGYLAFFNNTPIGWCNVNDRNNYQRLKHHYDYEEDPGKKICSIVCFLISPNFRGKGIAKLLLEKVIIDYTFKSYDYIEAFPANGEESCEKNYKGPLSLYQKFDFTIMQEFKAYTIVRRELGNG